jgi:hypothetical protein
MSDYALKDPKTIQPEFFTRVSSYLNSLTLAELHIVNEMTKRNFEINILEFFDQLLLTGEHLEQYEVCAALQEQRRKYVTWIETYQDDVNFITEIIMKNK